jgi:hypothetical protein
MDAGEPDHCFWAPSELMLSSMLLSKKDVMLWSKVFSRIYAWQEG